MKYGSDSTLIKWSTKLHMFTGYYNAKIVILAFWSALCAYQKHLVWSSNLHTYVWPDSFVEVANWEQKKKAATQHEQGKLIAKALGKLLRTRLFWWLVTQSCAKKWSPDVAQTPRMKIQSGLECSPSFLIWTVCSRFKSCSIYGITEADGQSCFWTLQS